LASQLPVSATVIGVALKQLLLMEGATSSTQKLKSD